MIDGTKLIAQQLALRAPKDVTFADGRGTHLTPVAYVPQLAAPDARLLLNGPWRVKRWPFRQEEDLAKPACRDRSWAEVEQPGKVFYYDPEEDPATVKGWNRVSLDHVDARDGAMLRRVVTIPKAWTNKRVYLCFDGIYPAGRIYLNGRLLGEHLSGLTPVEWDVTDLVQPGRRAVVAVRLLRKHEFVKMDMVRHACDFCGLAQDAYFHATERCQVADYHLLSECSPDLKRGRVHGTIRLRNAGSGRKACRVAVLVTDAAGKVVARCARRVTLGGGASAAVRVALGLRRPALWNDERPNLYSVSLRLAAPGQAEQEIRYRTGFRRFEVRKERATLNGNPVKFRGVNHLTYHPDFGMYTPREWLVRNLSLMKKANVNAIRTHFLGPRALADVCDELGIYLLQELPIDWGTHYIHDPAWVGPALLRLQGGVLRDRHHPSVMVWSIGNENMPWDKKVAPDGWNHLHIYDRFVKRLDPTRPTMFPPPGPANKVEGIFEVRVGDIADIHYSFKLIDKYRRTGKIRNPHAWDGTMETISKREAMKRGWSGVWFSSEYGIFNYQPDLLNAPYLSRISDLYENILGEKNTLQVFIDRQRYEWGLMNDDPACLGGAYFPWLCSGGGDNPWGWVRWGEDADWGIVTADLLPKPNFWALRALFSPVQFPARYAWKKGAKALVFKVRNGFNSIDLADCTLRTMMGGGGQWMGQMRSWQDVAMRGKPGREATIRIPIWNRGTLHSLHEGLPVVCRCILLDPRGFRVLTTDIVVTPPKINTKHAAMPIGPDAEL